MDENTNNLTQNRAGDLKKTIIKEYMRDLQKKSHSARVKRDPDTYKKMAKLRWEQKDELEIKII